MTNHKHIKCYCDLHEMMRNGCPSARGLPCRSAPGGELPPTEGQKLDIAFIPEKVKWNESAPVTRASVKDSAERAKTIYKHMSWDDAKKFFKALSPTASWKKLPSDEHTEPTEEQRRSWLEANKHNVLYCPDKGPPREYCKMCLASADDTLFCNKAITGGLCEECLVSKIENDDVAMSALRWLVDKGYTEDEVMFAYRRFLELHKKP
jgi:hypothetical protein